MFALGLLAAGQASTMTGTMAGQFVMEGFLDWRIPLWLRTLITRLISLGPAVAIAVYTSHETNLNNKVDQWINVLQSVQLPFALLPVLHFNSDAQLMGKFRLTRFFRFICWMLALIIIAVNVYLIAQYAGTDRTGVRLLVKAIFFVAYGTLITCTIWGDLKQGLSFLSSLLRSLVWKGRAGPMLMHMAFIGFAIWSLFRNTVLKHLLLKVEIWPERMSRFQKCLLGLEKHKRKAFFDEDEEGFWLDTCNLSKQEKDYLFIAMCDTLHRYMDTEQRIHPGDMAAAVKEALVRCRTARRKRAVRLEQLDREHREQKSMGRNGCLSRIIRWQRILSVSLYGADRQSELQEQETSCFENLFACLGRKALHMEMERTHEFLPEEFFDALIPVWQEITEGQGPHLSPRECHYWPETTARPRRVRLQGVEDEEDGDEEEGRTLHGSSLRLEALLGREQPPADREASGPLESFLLRAHSGCRIDLPTLITAHDELLSENLELRKQNEALQTQVASVRRSPKKLPQSLASAASPASPWREESTIGPNAEREFSESEEIAEEDVIPTAPSSWRDAEPGSPSIVNAAAAAFAAVRSTSSHTNSPTRHVQSAGSELADLSQDVVQPSPNQLFPSRPSSRAPSQRSSPNRKTQGRLLLPIPSAAERARPWNRGNSPSKSPGSASPWRNAMRPVRNKEWSDAGGNPMPQHVPFEFSGAVRPTDPGAWPQVE
eukprot:symbB.v1.2.012452.t1/scaffold860.1/size157271/21